METVTRKIVIGGIVQGVGFRPFVFMRRNPPPRSKIVRYDSAVISSDKKYRDFQIRLSPGDGKKTAAVSPDLDVCPDCLRELFDPENRRYLYPFINCTNCGPRYTIIRDIPYDRPQTTMAEFNMCPDCRAEYEDPADRRFHAQPNACPVCGPHLELRNKFSQVLVSAYKTEEYGKLFKQISQLLSEGSIIAVKGIGGYHLACDAADETAVATLRSRKYREDKPFAVLFPDLKSVKKICDVYQAERELLESVAHPIVLLKKNKRYNLAKGVAPNNHYLGAMLPYTPLHHLILHYYKKPLVMTSGNVSDEPIAYKDHDAFERLQSIADYFLVHNREIHIRCDDSVMRSFAGNAYPLRRSRGYAPEKLIIPWEFDHHILAFGPEQKNTFALAKDNAIYLSHHIGDMENLAVLKSFEEGIRHFRNVFDIQPAIMAYDLHPDYLSTKFAHAYAEKMTLKRLVFSTITPTLYLVCWIIRLTSPCWRLCLTAPVTGPTERSGAVNFCWRNTTGLSAWDISGMPVCPAARRRLRIPGRWESAICMKLLRKRYRR